MTSLVITPVWYYRKAGSAWLIRVYSAPARATPGQEVNPVTGICSADSG